MTERKLFDLEGATIAEISSHINESGDVDLREFQIEKNGILFRLLVGTPKYIVNYAEPDFKGSILPVPRADNLDDLIRRLAEEIPPENLAQYVVEV